MKRLIFVLLFVLLPALAHGAISSKMGSSPITAERGAIAASLGGGTFALDSDPAFVNATSGDAIGLRFSAPVGQTNAALTVYAFLTAETGSATDVRCAVFAGPSGAMDAQRPSTDAALATSAACDVSSQAANTWSTFSISSVSLTAGATYWLVIYNATASPASNYPTYMTRGWAGPITRFNAVTTTDGWAASDGTAVANDAPIVIKFSDGSLIGNPFVVSTQHASNANDRGNRYTFDAAVVVSGVYTILNNTLTTAIKVYQGASEVASVTLDRAQLNTTGFAIYFNAPVTFAAGTAYDVVVDPSGSTNVGGRISAGTSAPADVLSCMPAGLTAIGGATPGSYSTEEGFYAIFLIVDNIPAAAGGGGQRSYSF